MNWNECISDLMLIFSPGKGGDERHTILVKGLDHALLERRKAELLEGGKLDQVTDDDLEVAYQQSAKQAPPEDLALPSAKSKGSKKKHRDELLEQLKTSRAPADLVVVEKLKAAGKFKPIGFISPDDKKQDEERKERKRKKAEKKKNKALKTEPAADPTPFTNTSDSVTQNPQTQNDLPIPGTSIPVEKLAIDGNHISSPKSTQPSIQSSKDKASISILSETDIAVKKDEPIEDDDTFDIFGDAGEYKGLDAESSEDEQARDTKVEESTSLDVCSGYSPGKKRKNYFEDDECDSNHSEMLKSGEETACKTHDTLPKKMPIQEPEDDPAIGEHSTGDVPPSDQDLPRLTKLAGLSGSADIRSILAADALQEKEEKRKAKKQKNKSSGTKVLTDKDRLNRDVLEMENFLKRKKGRDNPPSANPES
jgi:IK cytokine